MEVCPTIEDFIGMYNPIGNPSSPVVKKHGREIAERVKSHYKKQLLLRQQKIETNFETLPAPKTSFRIFNGRGSIGDGFLT